MDSKRKIDRLHKAEDYQVWRFSLRIHFISKELFEIVNGLEKEPELVNEQALEEWKKKDTLAQDIIVSGLSQKFILHILNCETSHEMWTKLELIFDQREELGKQELLNRFFALKKSAKDSMVEHISKILDRTMINTKIIMTLPSEYRHFMSAWESTSLELQTMQNLTNRLILEESRINGSMMGNFVNGFDERKERKRNNSNGG